MAAGVARSNVVMTLTCGACFMPSDSEDWSPNPAKAAVADNFRCPWCAKAGR